MYLQPSTSTLYNDRRELFAYELMTGGHGQVYLSGGGTFTPTTSSYIFYRYDFLSPTLVTNVCYRKTSDDGTTPIYSVAPTFQSVQFPAGATWFAPSTCVTITSGTAIAYQYAKFVPEDYTCSPNCW